MALVDYSSDSGSEEKEPEPAPASKTGSSAGGRPSLPPIPASFHDLYASTVRTSTRDDPSLHQGRTRQIPHVPGNWPSHIYVEWFPNQGECDTLSSLLAELRADLGQSCNADDIVGGGLHGFLTSELGTPLPLHISLSRPFVLATDEKDDFLRRLTSVVEDQVAIPRVSVSPSALSWHRSPDSNRAFLVLRVQEADGGRNPGLAALLARCNALVRRFGQPALYSSGKDGDGADEDAPPDGRFHVSVGWSFAHVTEELRAHTAAVYAQPRYRDSVGAIKVPIESVKVKIGNVVTSLALPDGRRRRPRAQGSLFSV